KYFLICNHQSWIDILVLHKVFGERVSMLVFFLKKILFWAIPMAGWACWALGYPFMQRPTKSYLKKYPEKKNSDLEAIHHFCKKFKEDPVTVISFLEATRFTPEKKQHQHSPYKHLLKPKANSFAFVLSAMGESLQDIINVTIIYPKQGISFWSFICGKIDKVIVRYEVIPITPELRGDYAKNRDFRLSFQKWLNELWQQKDQLIEESNE
ncbi:MAG: 1-acyl-sn-glycerol-3-phosphate acyltransferase, partial [Gammaproteobacteria bacterium]|nr:1-acyl-sn-glycerol-3-phosphate acyltransferase [Gammaproteobacteria bacterium]